MYKNKTICVVVPAHNEETQIGKVIETAPGFVDRIVIINDKSSDKTSDVVRGYQTGANAERVVLIEHEINQGVGGAIASGYKWARDHDMDVAVVMAGDGQMDPDDMPALLDPVVDEGVDYAKGNRLVHAESHHVPRVRFWGNAVLSLLTKIASGYWHVADSQTGYTAIGRQALRLLDWDSMYKRYGQPNDLLVMLNVFNLRVRDVPIRPVYNVGEKSGIRIRKVLFTISTLLVRRFFWRLKEKYVIRDFHPLIFFYGLGFLLLLLSLVFFVRLCVLWWSDGTAPVLTAISLMFSTSMGLQALFFAMWFDMDVNKHLR